MATKAKILQRYPHLCDPRLPIFICCPSGHSIDEAKLAFKRVCFRDAIIIAVEAVRANGKPMCIWRVYYEMKNKDYDYEEDDNINSSNIPPSELPQDEASLKQLFENLTAKCGVIEMEVARKYYTENRLTAIVEYFPKDCECQWENFSIATEEPRMWPITEAEINFSRLKIHIFYMYLIVLALFIFNFLLIIGLNLSGNDTRLII